MAPPLRNPLRRRAESPPPPVPQGPDAEQLRREQLDDEIRFLREQERRRASTSIPPPAVSGRAPR